MQKSGYFARSAAANATDRALIRRFCEEAVAAAMRREPGLIGEDEEHGDQMRPIEFHRVKGGKAFKLDTPWFVELLAKVGQPVSPAAAKDSDAH